MDIFIANFVLVAIHFSLLVEVILCVFFSIHLNKCVPYISVIQLRQNGKQKQKFTCENTFVKRVRFSERTSKLKILFSFDHKYTCLFNPFYKISLFYSYEDEFHFSNK